MRCPSMLIATLVATLLVGVSVPFRPTVVQGSSMEPTLRSGGLYVLDTRYYRRYSPAIGDIIVFRHGGETYTKRIYALPGQRVLLLQYDDGIGNQIVGASEARTLRRLERVHLLPTRHLAELTVPPGRFFVVGDNPVMSSDSRDFGCIQCEEILGRVSL